MRDYYQVLGISRDAGSTDVRSAFRRLSLELHPDRTQDEPERTEEYKHVMEAYEVLSNEEVRAAYDDALAGRATGPPAITAQDIFEGIGSMAGLFMEAVARANPDKVEIGTCIVCKGLGELAIDPKGKRSTLRIGLAAKRRYQGAGQSRQGCDQGKGEALAAE